MRVVTEPTVRQALGLDDDAFLATSLDYMLKLAENEAFPRPWDWEMTPIGKFIDTNKVDRD